MGVRLTVLCENSVGRPIRAIGEHGFACLVETGEGAYLFDTGQGAGLLRNARVLARDLADLRAVILSHGHYDHAGGLVDVLGLTGPVDLYLHPDAFAKRYWVGCHETRSIGMPFRKDLLENLGARFQYVTHFCEIAPGLHLTGEVPRVTPFETGDPHLQVPDGDGDLVPDPFRDDLSLVIDTAQGLVVLLGCAHAGAVNILRHVVAQTGRDRIHAVIGGTHLGPVGEDQFQATLQAFRELGVEKIGAAHCTGQVRAAQLQSQFGGRVFFASVGSVFEV